MYCEKCGTKLEDSASFCTKCGASIKGEVVKTKEKVDTTVMNSFLEGFKLCVDNLKNDNFTKKRMFNDKYVTSKKWILPDEKAPDPRGPGGL